MLIQRGVGHPATSTNTFPRSLFNSLRRFYVDLSDGALIYCSTPKRVSLKFNWLTQYKSIKLSARSRAVHNFTPGTRKNLDVSEFYGMCDRVMFELDS